MKKTIGIMLALLLVLSLVACGKNAPPAAETGDPAPAATEEAPKVMEKTPEPTGKTTPELQPSEEQGQSSAAGSGAVISGDPDTASKNPEKDPQQISLSGLDRETGAAAAQATGVLALRAQDGTDKSTRLACVISLSDKTFLVSAPFETEEGDQTFYLTGEREIPVETVFSAETHAVAAVSSEELSALDCAAWDGSGMLYALCLTEAGEFAWETIAPGEKNDTGYALDPEGLPAGAGSGAPVITSEGAFAGCLYKAESAAAVISFETVKETLLSQKLISDGKETPEPDNHGTIPDPSEKPEEQGSWLEANWKPLIIIMAILLVALVVVVIFLMKKRRPADDQAVLQTAPLASTDPPTPVGSAPAAASASAAVKIARVHHVGKRKNQEDSFGVSNLDDEALIRAKGVMAVVADGMGGLKGGEEVSSLAVLSMLKGFSDATVRSSGEEELKRLLRSTVDEANRYLTRTVGLKKSGSTLMAVIVYNGMLSWLSVGDSRTALYRGGKLTDLNVRHVYGAELDELVRQNRISPIQAASNPNRDKLTSYVGMGELKHVDASVRPMQLYAGDKIILMSDGIFNTLSDPEIEQLLGLPTEQIGAAMESAVLRKDNPHQDNFTAVVLEYTGR